MIWCEMRKLKYTGKMRKNQNFFFNHQKFEYFLIRKFDDKPENLDMS